MLFPDGGGLDFIGARLSSEPGCLELKTEGVPVIMRPKRLLFESFPDMPSMSYFLLEAENLAPSGVYDELRGTVEELVELSQGDYAERVIWDAGYLGHDEDGDEIPLPSSARRVKRSLSGSFAIFAKASIYNENPRTYDGRHSQMSASEFRAHIQETVAAALQSGIPRLY